MHVQVQNRRRPGIIGAALLLAVMTFASATASAQSISPETLKARRELALFMMQAGDDQVVNTRVDCASGAWSQTVAEQRARGRVHTADAADTCVVALARLAKDQGLLGLYDQVVRESSGDPSVTATLPAAIGSALTKTKTDVVAVGNARGARITPALALDAGYTVGQQQRAQVAPSMPDLTVLKPIAERCLAQAEANMALCYSIGYIYAARTLHQLALVP